MTDATGNCKKRINLILGFFKRVLTGRKGWYSWPTILVILGIYAFRNNNIAISITLLFFIGVLLYVFSSEIYHESRKFIQIFAFIVMMLVEFWISYVSSELATGFFKDNPIAEAWLYGFVIVFMTIATGIGIIRPNVKHDKLIDFFKSLANLLTVLTLTAIFGLFRMSNFVDSSNHLLVAFTLLSMPNAIVFSIADMVIKYVKHKP